MLATGDDFTSVQKQLLRLVESPPFCNELFSESLISVVAKSAQDFLNTQIESAMCNDQTVINVKVFDDLVT